MIRLIGDIHGDLRKYYSLRKGAEKTIQVGDFGYGFISSDIHPVFDPNHRFIRGNHDCPTTCKMRPDWIPDGTVEDDWFFLGGAWSIDWAYRFPGVSWWDDEECSESELEMMTDVYSQVRPRVVVSHDCPSSVSKQLFIDSGRLGRNAKYIRTRTGEALQRMFEIHQPDYHFFGHWHIDVSEKIKGTNFHCLGEFSVIDFDG